MNSMSIHRVVKVQTKLKDLDNAKVRTLYITNEKDITFEISLFSTDGEALKIKNINDITDVYK